MTARWRVDTTDQFDREFKRLDKDVQRRAVAYLHDVADLDDPRQRGKGLTANHSGVWRYRVGDYAILAQVRNSALVVLTLRVGHRSDMYERDRHTAMLVP